MNNADIRALDRLIADIQFAGWHGSTVDWQGRPAPRRTRRADACRPRSADRVLATR
jgi:hypothetical protein